LHSDRGIGRIYWNGCKILEPCELEGVPYGRLAEAFPALRHRGGDPDPDAYVKAVNDLIVDESLLEIGILNLRMDPENVSRSIERPVSPTWLSLATERFPPIETPF
jgi:hypothetical protein